MDLFKQVSGKIITWSGNGFFNDGNLYGATFSRVNQKAPLSAPILEWPSKSPPISSVPHVSLTIDEAKSRADSGDSFAQAVVAMHYQLGWNVEKSPKLAAKYALASANAGEPLGKFRLGALLREGIGLPKDEQQGLNLQAASFNSLYAAQDPYSMTAAGVMIFQGKVIGQNVSQDERRRDAAALYKKAADAGYAPAQFNYAMCAEMGHGIPKNLGLRDTYLTHAAQQNYRLASVALGQKSVVGGTASEAQSLRNIASGKEIRLDSRSFSVPKSVNASGISTVLQRPPRASIVRACGTDPKRDFFYAVEGNSLTAWELPTGRLLKSYPIPNSENDQRWPLPAELQVDSAGQVFVAEFTEGERRSMVFDHTNESFSDFTVRHEAEREYMAPEDVELPTGKKVSLKLDGGDGEITIRGFSAFSSDGSLLNEQDDLCSGTNRDCGFAEQLASALGVPGQFFRNHEWLSPYMPAYQKSEMTFMRSWFKWNCKSIDTLVELSDDPRVSFVKDTKVGNTVKFPGYQLKPQRFVALNRDGTKLLSWILPEGYPGSPQPPDPCVLDVKDFTAHYINIPKGSAALNGRFDDDGNIIFVVGNILKVKRADGEYLVIKTLKKLFSTETGDELRSETTGEFSPYETGYAQGDLDAEEAVAQTRDVAVGSAQMVAAANAKHFEGLAKNFRKRIGADGSEASWGAVGSPYRDHETMVVESADGDGITINCPKGENFINVERLGDLMLFATSKGLYSCDVKNLETVDFWPVPAAIANAAARSSVVEYAEIDPKGRKAYMALPDGSIRILAVSQEGSFREVATIQFTTEGEVILLQSDNTYANLGGSTDGVHFSDGHRAYPFEQFDLRLNRPDIVLERLGAPEEAVAIAKQLREKRLKRMGVTEEMLKPDFHVPELEIVGDVPATTDSGEINLSIRASDSKYPLERLKVYVNNVPVNGRDGELLREESKADAGLLGRITGTFAVASAGPQTFERTIPIKLAAGRNKIQVSVLNNAGAESLYANAEVNCTAKRPKPTLYAVAMGVSEYSNPEWNLKYAAKDAQDVLAKLKARAGDSYGEVKELLLTDKQVTKESIAKVKDFLSGATIDDTVLLFVAGHGLLDSNYDYYFGTADIDFNNPTDKGIAFEEFDDLLADLPSLRKSLLIDTCHAGELDEEEKTLLASAGGVSAALPMANGVAVRSIGTRGMNVKAIEGARGASEWYDRLQGLFVDLRRGSGSTILSSSAGAEYALESSEQQNGLFTYAVLEALDGKKDADTDKDGSVEMSELGEYVKKRVSDLTNNKQTPNTRRVNLEGDFTLAKTK